MCPLAYSIDPHQNGNPVEQSFLFVKQQEESMLPWRPTRAVARRSASVAQVARDFKCPQQEDVSASKKARAFVEAQHRPLC